MVMVDERTPLTSDLSGPLPLASGPSGTAVHHLKSHESVRERQVRTFQCWICSAILGAFALAIVISISYIIFGDATQPPLDGANTTAADFPELLNLISFPLVDESSPEWNGTAVSDDAKAAAIAEGEKALGDKELLEETLSSPPLNSPSFRHQKSVGATKAARLAAKVGFVEDRATQALVRWLDIRRRGSIGRGPPMDLPRAHRQPRCDLNARYRTANGTCNSKERPYEYGVAMIPFRRQLNPDYGDGISAPRASVDGAELPSARQVSLEIHRPSYHNDPNFSVMLAVWGQFLDHDITSTALTRAWTGSSIECCDPGQPQHPECFPVPLGPGDPYYTQYNVTCMNFVRSVPAPTGHFGPRQQLNQATAFIDGSVVYGSDDERMGALRTGAGGQLRMLRTPDGRDLLPVSTDPLDGCNEQEMNAAGKYCFESGDARANENLHLTSMHLIWARHHNSLARGLARANPHWDDERLFQEARRILAAQMQHITYAEFVPVIVGNETAGRMGLLPASAGGDRAGDTYNATVDASIANVFAGAAFRFAHTLLPGLMKQTRNPAASASGIELHRMLFNPYSLYARDGLDNALGGAIGTALAKYDQYFSTELTERLFEKADEHLLHGQPCGLDLVSLNIQRGRDHGLPAYPRWRKHCHLTPADSWEELERIVDPESYRQMRRIYREPANVDVYSGALSEAPVRDGIVGPLLTCLIGDQFLRLKQGDSFWYERRRGPQRFTEAQLQQIYNTKLSSVICRNSDHIEQSPVYLMKRTDSRTNPETDCKQLDTFDFEPFREDAEQPQRNRPAKIATERMKVLVFEPKATGTTTEHAVGAEVQDEEEGERQAASTTTVATTTDATTTTTTTRMTTMNEAVGA
ncbi:LOW QUALITY PROTEIN: chorion peroxidase [Anopheles arabiensis]|uniref:LOW QUALITY PROTEIN: chorion peroxidase n=1 Tax=Anopheles arabiensis TaxID=7173 RepID=UPI001AADB556|nr:LOW QUALITY PROTEIN: chorion peroxidase [Anopheles arabiensis]